MRPVAAPAGFEPLSASPFTELVGPLYIKRQADAPVLGVEVTSRHVNTLGWAHGGLLMTLADVSLSRAVREHLPTGATMATADLHIAFLDAVREGQWLEGVPSIDRVGRALIHASCVLRADGVDVSRAMGTFAVRLPHLS